MTDGGVGGQPRFDSGVAPSWRGRGLPFAASRGSAERISLRHSTDLVPVGLLDFPRKKAFRKEDDSRTPERYSVVAL